MKKLFLLSFLCSFGSKATVDDKTLFWVAITPNSSATVTSAAEFSELALRGYNLELSLEDELGGALNTDSEYFTISGGTSNDIAGYREMEEGVVQFALDADLSDSNYRIVTSINGYVDKLKDTGVLSTTRKSVVVVLQYAHRIDIEDSNGDAVLADSVTVDDTGDSEFGHHTCTVVSGAAYCNLSPSQDDTSSVLAVVTVVSGAQTVSQDLSADRDDNSDAQVLTTVVLEAAEADPSTGVLRATVKNSTGSALTGLTQSDFSVSGGSDNTVYSFVNNGDGTYDLRLDAGGSDVNYELTVSETGYSSSTVATGNISSSSTTSVTLTLTASVSASETASYVLTVENQEGNEIPSLSQNDFTVSGGTNNSVQSFSRSGGEYTFILSADSGDTNYAILVQADGYVSDSIDTGSRFFKHFGQRFSGF